MAYGGSPWSPAGGSDGSNGGMRTAADYHAPADILQAPIENIIYSDYAFDLKSMATFEGTNQGEATWINYEAKYNFYIRNYEETTVTVVNPDSLNISRPSERVPETVLPNLYVLLHELSRLVTDPARTVYTMPSNYIEELPPIRLEPQNASVLWKHLTLNDRIKDVLVDIFDDGRKIGDEDKGQYYVKWADEINRIWRQHFERRRIEDAMGTDSFSSLGIENPADQRGSITAVGQGNSSAVPEFSLGYDESGFPTFEQSTPDERLVTTPTPSQDRAAYSIAENTFSEWLPRFRNLVIPINSVAAFNQFHKKRVMFPMSVEISFKTDSVGIPNWNTSFGDMFREAGFSDYFVSLIIANQEPPAQGTKLQEWSGWMKVDRSFRDTQGTITNEFVRYWDIGKIFTETLPPPADAPPEKRPVFLKSPAIEEAAAIASAMNGVLSGNCSNPTAIQKSALLGQMREIITDGIGGNSASGLARNYEQIINGNKAYSETLLYRIEKRNLQTNEFVQNIWFPNSTQVDVLNYVDTQVLYGIEYRYTVYAYQFVVGNKYRYKLNKVPHKGRNSYAIYTGSNAEHVTEIDYNDDIINQPFLRADWISFVNQMFTCNDIVLPRGPDNSCDEQVGRSDMPPLDQDLSEICVFTEPSLCLFEIEQYSFIAKAADRPPIAPNVDINEYMGVNDKILLSLRSGIGKYYEPFIMMQEKDADMLEGYLVNQALRNRLDIGFQGGDEYSFYGQRNATSLQPIEFKSDDPNNTFDIWRTTVKPIAWTDFKFYKRISSANFFAQPGKSTSGAAFEDEIKPNVKYYYTFRAVDVHGNVSNPSPVYEVEIIDDKGSSYLSLRTYPSPLPEDPRTPTKNARKYIQIKPSSNQTLVNEKASGLRDQSGERIPVISGRNTTSHQIILGDGTESVWSSDTTPTKFKIRLTSTKTGKKIDFNVYCKTSNIYNSNI